MRLVLHDMVTALAEEEIKDDAFELWVKLRNEMKYKAAPAAFYSRKHIQPQSDYLHISFVDTESGELLFINCLEKMHKAMVAYNLYPEIILNGLKRTE